MDENYYWLDGPNFSGRTEYMRTVVHEARTSSLKSDRSDGRAALIGECPSSTFSGLFSTSIDELAASGPKGANHKAGGILFERLLDVGILSKNPFRLSGGEQVSLAVLLAINSMRRTICIDTSAEQLAPELAGLCAEALHAHSASERLVLVCDNRVSTPFRSFGKPIPMGLTTQPSWVIQNEDWNEIFPKAPSHSVEVRSLTHSFESLTVLKNLEAIFEPGTIYRIKGANGAGKTTLSRVLSGILKPNSLIATVDGKRFRPWRAPSEVFAYNFQNPDHQFFRTTVMDELSTSKMIRRSQAEGILSSFGLSQWRNDHPLDIPYVARKRLAVASAIGMSRAWTILDEPTLGQDSHSVRQLVNLINQLARAGRGFIIISHNEDFVEQLNPVELNLVNGALIH